MSIKSYVKQLRKVKDTVLDIEGIINKSIQVSRLREFAMNAENVEPGISPISEGSTPIVVSLTTYGRRLQWVYLTIESLLQQTIKPNKIVLCISEELYPFLPEIVKRQQKRGLDILYCKDIRSYTKLLPTLRKYPEAAIITVDDDILYPCDFIEYLVKAFYNNPSQIHFYYGHQMGLDKAGNLTSYNEWVKSKAENDSVFNMPTGVDGILYPPHSLHEEVFNEDVFLKICPTADDIWFRAMSLMKGTVCHHVERALSPRSEFVSLDTADITSLASVNRGLNRNDIQAKAVFEKYGLTDLLVF